MPADYTRPFNREAPTYNFVNDLTWTKGSHNITTGANVRFVRNERTNYRNAFESYSFSRGNLSGLGSDIVAATNAYLAGLTGNAGIRLTDATTVTRAFGNLLGVITTGNMTYTYDRDGNPVPIGEPSVPVRSSRMLVRPKLNELTSVGENTLV